MAEPKKPIEFPPERNFEFANSISKEDIDADIINRISNETKTRAADGSHGYYWQFVNLIKSELS